MLFLEEKIILIFNYYLMSHKKYLDINEKKATNSSKKKAQLYNVRKKDVEDKGLKSKIIEKEKKWPYSIVIENKENVEDILKWVWNLEKLSFDNIIPKMEILSQNTLFWDKVMYILSADNKKIIKWNRLFRKWQNINN